MRIKKGLTWLLLSLLLAGIGLPVLLLGLAATEAGSRYLLLGLQPLLPISISADNIQGRLLGELELRNLGIAAGPHQGTLEQFRLDWRPGDLLAGRLTVRQLRLKGLRLTLGDSPPGPSASEEPFHPPALPLAFSLEQVQLEDAQIQIQGQVQQIDLLQLRAHSEGNRLLLESLELRAPPLEQLALSGGIELAGPIPLQASLHWRARLPQVGEVQGEGDARGNLGALELRHDTSGPLRTSLKGKLSLGELPAFDLSGDWSDLGWPMQGSPEYRSAQGRFSLRGNLAAYQLGLEAELAGQAIPDTRLSLSASGDRERMQLAPLRLDTLKGRIELAGQVGWRQAFNWDLRLDAQELQPAAQWPGVPGTLSGQLTSQGRLEPNGPQLTAELVALKGNLHQQALSGKGKLALQGERLQVEELLLRAGDNQLKVHGTLARQAAFDFQLQADKLAQLWPGLAGSLTGKGQLQGDLQAPRLSLQAKGQALAFQQHKIKSLQAEIHWDPDANAASATDLQLSGLQAGGVQIDRFQLKGPGNLAQHQWQLDLSGPELTAQLNTQGGLAAGRWQGQLLKGHLTTKTAGNWQLNKAFALMASGQEGRIGAHCWHGGQSSVCLEGELNQGALQAKANLKAIPLALAQPILAPDDRLSGNLSAELTATGTLEAPQVKASLRLPEASYRPSLNSAPLTLDLRQLQLEATLRDQRLSGELDLGLRLQTQKGAGPWGSAKGALKLDLGRQPLNLDARLALDYPDISPLVAFVPAIRDLRGAFSMDAQLQGPLATPQVRGKLSLDNGGLKVPDIGVEIKELALKANNAGNDQLRITGQARSGNGQLRISGDLVTGKKAPRLELRLQGQNFQAARIPMAEVEISPDLVLLLENNVINLSGKVHVPKALIALKEIPQGSVALSQDTVIVGRQDKKKPQELPPAQFNSQVRLTLGEEVRFQGFGLKTRITGGMEVNAKPGYPPLGNGTLSLAEGSFKAYGQDLNIERGRFLFAGPLDHPAIDISAVRVAADKVKAGVMVTGGVRNPEVKVFSVPAKPTTEALSYLLTGSGLSSASADQAQAIRGAAFSMEKAGANLLTGAIAKKLGLSEINFGGNTMQESAVTVGKNLSPDIYMRYVQNLFDQTAMVELGYKINKALDIKVYGGTAQGVDLQYHIEK